MVKLLNILVVAFLAVAPGMNVHVLIHSADLCAYIAPTVVEITDGVQVEAEVTHCGHRHHCDTQQDQPKDNPDDHDGCPHICSSVAPATAAPVMQVRSFDAPAYPSAVCILLNHVEAAFPGGPKLDDSRPPPGPDGVATTILLI